MTKRQDPAKNETGTAKSRKNDQEISDYKEWRKTLWEELSVKELSRRAANFVEKDSPGKEEHHA